MRKIAGQFGTKAWSSLALALVALTIRLLVPVGYMIGPTAKGGDLPIVLCTSQGVEIVLLDQDAGRSDSASGSQDDHTDPQPTGHPCAFAGAATGIAVERPPIVESADWSPPRRPPASIPDALPGRGLAAPPPPQTGPPHLI